MAPLNLNAQRTADLAIPGFDHGQYFADPGEKRGIRNNNPGNIEPVRNAERSAMHTEFGRLGSDGRFAVYSTPMGGIAANFEVLNDMQSRRGLNTIAGIVNAWAPPFENNTKAYIAAVSKATGIGPNDRLPSFFSRPDIAASILSAKYGVENGINLYDKSTITAGVEMARDAMSRNFSKMDGISERGAMARNMEDQRQSFRGPTDFGAPVWDGTWDKSVVPVETAPIADIPSFDLGANLNSAVTSSPFGDASIPQGSLASAYDYTAPGPDLGFNLSSAMPSSDFTPSIGAYDFAGGFSPQNAAMNEATGYLGGIYAGSVPSGGQFAPDTSYAPGPDLGANLSNALASDYVPADAGWGRAADKDRSVTQASDRTVSMGYQPGFGQEMGTLGQNPGFGAGLALEAPAASYSGPTLGREVSASPMGYAGTPSFGPASSLLSFSGSPVASMPSGMPSFAAMNTAMQFDPATFAFSAPAAWSEDKQAAPAKPFDAPPAQSMPDLPGYALPEDVPAPDLSAPRTATTAPSSRSAPSTAPTGFRSSPTLAAPAMAPAVNVPTMGVREASPAPSQTYADALSGFGSSKDFLGSLMGGNRGGLEALSGLTGTNYAGLAQMAMSGDQYAQPAMLGLERAYSNAVGQPGNLSLFGGGNSGAKTDNLGPVVDQATGQVLGNYDPSDPKNQGLFGGLGGWLGGLFGGNDGLGTTPGAGGLY